MNINGLIGYIGGYIGLFVGYSILQIPKTLLTLARKCKKLFHVIQNQNEPIISVGTRVNVHERGKNESHNLQQNYTKEDIKDSLQRLQNQIYDLSKIVNEAENVKMVY